jgi:membrane associated rhomboid family serine protease
MPICPTCGKTFSGFSLGPNPATECSACRKAKAQAQVANRSVIDAAHLTAPSAVLGRLPLPAVTLTIIALNVLVYLAMSLSGASWTDPNIRDAVKWGADFGPLTLSSDGWRLLTSMFVHFGIIHIALNMWCLWNLGTTLEPFMGRKVFGVMYVASGLAASLVSTAWNPWRVSAGASGAIFGVAGALVSYFALKKTPLDRALVDRNLKSLGLFIFYNLLYGIRGGVDNSAHLGGLAAGLILGAAIPPMMRVSPGPAYIPVGSADLAREPDEESRANRRAFGVAMFSAVILILGFVGLHAQKLAVARYGSAVNLIKAGKLDLAVGQLQESVKLDPDAYLAQALLGELLLDQQNPAAAETPLEQAANLVPHAYDVQQNLALAYLGQGRASDANYHVTVALEQLKAQPTWQALFIRGAAETQLSQFPRAAEDMSTVVKAKPDFREGQQALAQLRNLHPAGAPPQLEIPYAKIVLQSEYWPLYP